MEYVVSALRGLGAVIAGAVWYFIFSAAVIFGFLIVSYDSYVNGGTKELVGVVFLAAASMLVGAFLGFLFGIPRALQSDGRAFDPGFDATSAGRPAPAPRTSTNLEQISDWLTKILVGVALTQMATLPGQIGALGVYFSKIFGVREDGSAISVVIIVFFAMCGFFCGYFRTRMYLAGDAGRGSLSSRADLQAIDEKVSEFYQAQAEQAETDAAAISLVTQYFSPREATKIDLKKLKTVVAHASAPIKAQLFHQARRLRLENRERTETKLFMERAIPVYEALIEGDKDRRSHENHGELGFALKDKLKPDYLNAEIAFTVAIEIRGNAGAAVGLEAYEYNRAICRIKKDQDFAVNRPSSDESRKNILADLQASIAGIPDLANDPDVISWLKINNIEDVRTAKPEAE
jgi:hypothetical protein